MKKVFIYSLFLLLFLFIFLPSIKVEADDFDEHHVLTPNNTLVPVEINASANILDTPTGYFISITGPNGMFNCHYFAWHLYWRLEINDYNDITDNLIRRYTLRQMLDPSAYYTDGSYIETDRIHASIIAYFKSDGSIEHSGIVINTIDNGTPLGGVYGDSNLVNVLSKWNYSGGIFLTRGNGWESEDLSYIKYYIRSTEACPRSYTYTNVGNNPISHIKECSCGRSTSELHSMTLSSTPSLEYHLRHCRYCSYQIPEAHNFVPFGIDMFRCSICGKKTSFYPIYMDSIADLFNSNNDTVSSNMIKIDENHIILKYNNEYYMLYEDTYENSIKALNNFLSKEV